MELGKTMDSAAAATIDGLIDQLQRLKGSISSDAKTRREAISTSRKLLQNLEDPEKIALDMIYSVRTPALPYWCRLSSHMETRAAFHAHRREDRG
jgi:hypothetical protein